MRSTCLAFLLCTSPSLLWADAPVPPTTQPQPAAGPLVRMVKELSGQPGELIPIQAESGAELVTWTASPGIRVINDEPADPTGKSKLLHAKLPGVYVVVAMIPHEKAVRSAVCVVTIGPKADPVPDPIPAPVTDPVAFLVIIEETGEATAGRGALFADPKLAARLKEKKIGWRVADQDVKDSTGKPPADLVPYLGKAKGKPLPQVFFVAANGKTIYQGDLPKDVDGVLELLGRYGG